MIAALLCASITIVDGDTIRCGNERIRIVGYDTPELHAQCEAELRLAMVAKDKLSELLRSHHLTIQRLPEQDAYNRTLASIYLDGTDLASIMLSTHLARPCNEKSCRKSWCQGVD